MNILTNKFQTVLDTENARETKNLDNKINKQIVLYKKILKKLKVCGL